MTTKFKIGSKVEINLKDKSNPRHGVIGKISDIWFDSFYLIEPDGKDYIGSDLGPYILEELSTPSKSSSKKSKNEHSSLAKDLPPPIINGVEITRSRCRITKGKVLIGKTIRLTVGLFNKRNKVAEFDYEFEVNDRGGELGIIVDDKVLKSFNKSISEQLGDSNETIIEIILNTINDSVLII